MEGSDKIKDLEKKKKDREKRLKETEAKQKKNIQRLVNFPFKMLAQVSLIVSLIVFIMLYFSRSKAIIDSLYTSFLVFSGIYFGVGLIIAFVFYILSEQKKKEIEEKKRQEEEQRREDEIRKEEELARLEQLQNSSYLDEFRSNKRGGSPESGIPGMNEE